VVANDIVHTHARSREFLRTCTHRILLII